MDKKNPYDAALPSRLQPAGPSGLLRFTHPRSHAVLGWIGQTGGVESRTTYEVVEFRDAVEAMRYCDDLKGVAEDAVPTDPLDSEDFNAAIRVGMVATKQWIRKNAAAIQDFQDHQRGKES